MKKLLRQLALAILPARICNRWQHYLMPEKFYFLAKEDFEYAEDNLYTRNASPFLNDRKFLDAYRSGEETDSWHGNPIRWRAYIACWAAEQTAKLPGDFIECGVNRGGLARSIATYTQFAQLDKYFYLIDTFSGLVPEYLTQAEQDKHLLDVYAYYKDGSKEYVTDLFASVPNAVVVQGRVPDILSMIPAQQVAFLSLDMNCTMPEIKAAEHFWSRMVPGGIILLDDYAQKIHSEQQIAFDEFARQRGTSVLALPTGQGMILKTSLR